jgi:hypothetical protein
VCAFRLILGRISYDCVYNLVHPGWNVVIVHTQHKTKFDGKQGTDYAHEHKELSMSFPVGTTIGFEIYTFRSGEFTLEGDGGFMNACLFTSPFLLLAHDGLYSGHTVDSSRKTRRTSIICSSRRALSRKGQLLRLKLVSRARSQMRRRTLPRLLLRRLLLPEGL